jgi:G patch domain/KOW motif-containing protein
MCISARGGRTQQAGAAGQSGSAAGPAAAAAAPPTWVQRHLRVRIVSSSLEGGRAYNKKGVVVNLSAATLPYFSVCLDELTGGAGAGAGGSKAAAASGSGGGAGAGTVVARVLERQVETVVPQVGGRVRVLRGPREGEVALVRERHRDSERVLLQLEDDLDMFAATFDDVCELAL